MRYIKVVLYYIFSANKVYHKFLIITLQNSTICSIQTIYLVDTQSSGKGVRRVIPLCTICAIFHTFLSEDSVHVTFWRDNTVAEIRVLIEGASKVNYPSHFFRVGV